ncbi:MAG: type II secretion system protein [Cyanobacteria bacterium P01_E01_bin.6]
MQFDRIFNDIVDWIRRILWKQRERQAPYEIYGRKPSPFGTLCLISRDTPRACRTWVFMPKRTTTISSKQRDIHLCLDTLSPLDKAKASAEHVDCSHVVQTLTHKISIFWASHWLHADGSYDIETIWEGFYDLQGRSEYPDKMAIAVLDNLAALLLHQHHSQINWRFECDASRKQLVVGASGFTLLEMLVTIVIIGILSAIAAPILLNQVTRSREAEGQELLGYAVRSQTRHFTKKQEFTNQLPIDEIPTVTRYFLQMDVEPDSVEIEVAPIDPESMLRSFRACLRAEDMDTIQGRFEANDDECR